MPWGAYAGCLPLSHQYKLRNNQRGLAHHATLQDVQRNLEPKNRDKFTQNLTIVRHEFRSKV